MGKPNIGGPHFVEHPLVRPICGAIASSAAECATLPIDLLKVRFQLANGTQSAVGAVTALVRTEGVGALFKGITPAICRQASYQSVRMGIYEPMRNAVCGKDSEPKLWQMFLAGGLAGAIGVFIASPFDLIKVRKQAGLLESVGTLRRRYTRRHRRDFTDGFKEFRGTLTR